MALQSRRWASMPWPGAERTSSSTSALRSWGKWLVACCFTPPFLSAWCRTDGSCCSVLPGHLHAFYLEYVYFDRREQAREGRFTASHAPGIYSDRVQTGGGGYGTITQQPKGAGSQGR